MTTPKIAILCPVLKNPENVAAMLDNYYRHHGDQAFHVLHVARAAESDIEDVGLHTKTPVEFYFNKDSWRTSYSCVMGAFLSSSVFLSQNALDYTHVYIHTDGDLLIRGDLVETIGRHGNGFKFGKISQKWTHHDNCVNDPNVKQLLELADLTMADIRTGRQEGAFFTKDVWDRIIDLCLQVYGERQFERVALNWPIEEMAIPTLAARFATGQHFRNIIRTKEVSRFDVPKAREHPDNVVKVDDIKNTILKAGDDGCIGMKWFSPQLSDAARHYLQTQT